MAVITTTTQTQLKSSFIRMDAEFFRPEHVIAYKRIEEISGGNRLRHLCDKITQGSNPHFSETGFPCVNGKNVYFGTMQEGKPNYVSAQEFKRLDGYRLRQQDIVVTLKHATKVGRAWIVEDDKPRVFSRNIGLIRLSKDSDVKASSLLIYLWTKSGQLCLERCATGGTSGQITLPIGELKHIPVPLFPEKFQLEIDEMFRRSRAAALLSEKSYSKAQQLLESEFGLDEIRFQKPVGYTARFSEAMTGGRIDADYFQPQYSVVRALIQAYPGGYEPLLNCANSLRPNIDPSKAPNHLFNYIELSNINASLGIVEGFLPSIGANLPSRAKRQVKTGDVIASAVVGSVDKAAIIADEQDGFLASTGFFHLRPKSVSPMYLLMLVRSQCVRMQFQQQSTGGILSAVPDSRLKHVIIPKLPVSLQEEIDNLATKSHLAKHTSDALLDQAKSSVEQLIEEAVKS